MHCYKDSEDTILNSSLHSMRSKPNSESSKDSSLHPLLQSSMDNAEVAELSVLVENSSGLTRPQPAVSREPEAVEEATEEARWAVPRPTLLVR